MPKPRIRNSRNTPLKVATIGAGILEDGQIGMTFAPGSNNLVA